MKKFFSLVILIMFTACGRFCENEFELVYDVYYPTETCTYVEKLKGGENSSYFISSRKGTNYLYFSNGNFFQKDDILYSGTAPFRVVSFKRIK